MAVDKDPWEFSKTLMLLPDFTTSVSADSVRDGYLGMLQLSFVPLLLCLASLGHLAHTTSMDSFVIWVQSLSELTPNDPIYGYLAGAVLAAALTAYVCLRSAPVYLVDFTTYKAPKHLWITKKHFEEKSRGEGLSEESIKFQMRILETAGVGEKTAFPPAIMDDPTHRDMAGAREEARTVMFDCLDQLFAKCKITPKDVDIIIVNCSLFVPTPSLAAMIINHYKMRPDTLCYNLGGMGCSAGVISIDLAKDLLQVHRGSRAVVVSTENITLNWYVGETRSKLIPNCIFRVGGAAILLSNCFGDRFRSKYQLAHTVRTHVGRDTPSYKCVYQDEDDKGVVGVTLTKELMSVAGEALKTNITTLGPLVLPLTEQFQFFVSLVKRKFLGVKCKPYIPDFKKAFDHFCIHAGGRAVIDAIEKNLSLSPDLVEPSRMTLHRFGNTSSSSIWYELSFIEGAGRVKAGDRVWQIAFGSGFKCNSAVWHALKPVKPYTWDE